VKARPVKKLDPTRSLGENAARIVQVRLDEMLAFAPRALNGKIKAQHDMRIAAKRLRYVLEVTGFVFGKPADTARRRARDLQDILGEIHDCDVMLPRVRDHMKRLQQSDAASVRANAGRAPDLDPRLAARAPHRTSYRGLDVLAVYLEARRGLLEQRFADFWKRQEQTRTWVKLERAVEGHLRRTRDARRAAKAAQRARERAEAAERAAHQAEAQAERARLDRERAERHAEHHSERPAESEQRTERDREPRPSSDLAPRPPA
jgi:CHAD domain